MFLQRQAVPFAGIVPEVLPSKEVVPMEDINTKERNAEMLMLAIELTSIVVGVINTIVTLIDIWQSHKSIRQQEGNRPAKV